MPDHELDPVDALTQLSFLLHGTLERRAAEHGLSIVQTRLLGILRDRRPTMNQLARLLSLDKSSVTGLVGRAERRNLVARRPSPDDGRSVLVELTAAGRSLVAEVSRDYEADVAAIVERLPARDRDTLARLAGRAVVGYAEERGVDLFATSEP